MTKAFVLIWSELKLNLSSKQLHCSWVTIRCLLLNSRSTVQLNVRNACFQSRIFKNRTFSMNTQDTCKTDAKERSRAWGCFSTPVIAFKWVNLSLHFLDVYWRFTSRKKPFSLQKTKKTFSFSISESHIYIINFKLAKMYIYIAVNTWSYIINSTKWNWQSI